MLVNNNCSRNLQVPLHNSFFSERFGRSHLIPLTRYSDFSDTDSLISSDSSIYIDNYGKQLLVKKHTSIVVSKICKGNIYELKCYIYENNVDLKKLASYDEDKPHYDKLNLLILAIEEESTTEIIEYLLKECTYKCFNYEVDNKTPLYLAIEKEDYTIADILIKYGADVNESPLIEKLQEKNLLKESNLKYLLKKGLKIKNTEIEKIYKPILLKIISEKYIFTNTFIIKLLYIYKNNKIIPRIEFKNIIQNEKQKIRFSNNHYENVKNDFKNINILFNYDGSYEQNMKFKIIKYKILRSAIELYINDYENEKNHEKNLSYVKNILNYNALNFREIISMHMDLLNKSNETSDTVSDLSKLVIESTIEKFCIMDDGKYDSKKINYIINMAIKVDDEKMVNYIIKYCKYSSEIDLNKKDINNEIVIIKALGNEEIFETLLDNGANINVKDKNGNPLISLIINNFPYLLNTLLSYENLSINEKNINNDLDSVILLITYGEKYGIDMNVKDRKGYTPLIISYRLGYIEIFKYLIYHFDINEKDSNGFNILYYVISKEDNETLNLLLNNNININNIDNYENSIFQVLINKGFKNTLLKIMRNPEIKINANLNHVNSIGDTPLLTIIKNNNEKFKDIKKDIIKEFLKLGSNANITNKNGDNALTLAFKSDSSIIEILLGNGAIIDFKIILKSIESNDVSIFICLLCYITIINLSKNNKILILKNLFNSIFKYSKKKCDFTDLANIKCMEMFKHYIKYLINNDDSNIIYESNIIKTIIRFENIELLEALTENGINLSIKFKNFLPLEYAKKVKSKKVTNYLLKKYYKNIYSDPLFPHDKYLYL